MYVDLYEDFLDAPITDLDEDALPCDFYKGKVATFKCKECGLLKCNEKNDADGGESSRGIGGRCEDCDNNFTFEKL